MLESHQVEQLIRLVVTMDHATLAERLLRFRAPFPIDFTPEFLDHQPTDRLRHIYVALCLQCGHLPADSASLVSAA
jgi:hypothetical protein